MNPLANDLETLRDWLRYAVSRFGEAELAFGHGTTNAYDEAAYLLLRALHLLVPSLPEKPAKSKPLKGPGSPPPSTRPSVPSALRASRLVRGRVLAALVPVLGFRGLPALARGLSVRRADRAGSGRTSAPQSR